MRAVFVVAWLLSGSVLAQEVSPSAEASPSKELGVQLGYAWSQDNEGGEYGGPGFRLHLLKRFGSYFAVGPEAAMYARAGSTLFVNFDGRTHHYRTVNRPLLQFGAVARVGAVLGRVRPSVMLGVAWYQSALSTPGVSLGAEVEVRFADWLPLVIDARAHEGLGGIADILEGSVPRQSYRSIGLGWRRAW